MAQLFTEWINLLLELNWWSLFSFAQLAFKFSVIQLNYRQRDGERKKKKKEGGEQRKVGDKDLQSSLIKL